MSIREVVFLKNRRVEVPDGEDDFYERGDVVEFSPESAHHFVKDGSAKYTEDVTERDFDTDDEEESPSEPKVMTSKSSKKKASSKG